MQPLNLPAYEFRTRINGQNTEIFDSVRRKFVTLTPEEWVRQHFIRYMAEELGYPLSLMSVEKGMVLNSLKKRTDIVVHDRAGKPWMIVECKAPEVPVTAETLYQAGNYHQKLQSRFVLATNGRTHICCEFINDAFSFLTALPKYPD